jgi:hypothetical protein
MYGTNNIKHAMNSDTSKFVSHVHRCLHYCSIYYLYVPYDMCHVALESTQPLTEIITRDIPLGGGGGEEGRCIGLTTLPPLCADCLEIVGASNSWSPKSLSRPVMG